MENNKVERAFIFFITMFLLAGIIVLRVKDLRAKNGPIIVRSAVKPLYSLKEVEKEINERRKVNVNAADPKELERLPGVGPAMAQRIYEYRMAHGDFAEAEDIDNVAGIGPKKLEKIKCAVKLR
jgi:competence protein ComEA